MASRHHSGVVSDMIPPIVVTKSRVSEPSGSVCLGPESVNMQHVTQTMLILYMN